MAFDQCGFTRRENKHRIIIMPEAVKTIDAEQFKQTVFFRMVVRKPGTRAKVRSVNLLQEYLTKLRSEQQAAQGVNAQVAIDGVSMGEAPKGTVGITKRLFIPVAPSKEDGKQVVNDPVEKANRFLSSVKERLCGRFGAAQPSRIMDGLFVLPEGKVQAYKEEIEAAQARLTLEFLPEIENGYEDAIHRAESEPLIKGGLGPLFSRGDYLSAQDFCASFEIDVLWLKLGVPDNLPKELQDQFRAEFQAKAQAAQEEIFTALRVQFADLIAHAQEVLTPGDDGKAKKFHASTLDNIRSFTAIFQDRNIFNDESLAALVEQARTVLTGVDLEAIRKDGGVRDQAARAFGEIKNNLDKLVTVQTSRKFDFSD